MDGTPKFVKYLLVGESKTLVAMVHVGVTNSELDIQLHYVVDRKMKLLCTEYALVGSFVSADNFSDYSQVAGVVQLVIVYYLPDVCWKDG